MITKEDFEVPFPSSYEEMRALEEKIDQLLRERDAYREVAILNHGHREVCDGRGCDCKIEIPKEVDAEAAAILEQRKGER